MRSLFFVFTLALCTAGPALGQAFPAAHRLGDLQLGGDYTPLASSDYVPNKFRGFGFYGDFDFRAHYGVEVDFHQLNDPQKQAGTDFSIYERSYEVGGRYLRHYYNIFTPYVKGLYGRGVFNFPADCLQQGTYIQVACTDPTVIPSSKGPAANLAYNMIVAGGGVDIAVHPRINVRADYEWQHWFGFPPNGLTPQLFTIGVAYHFPPGIPRR